MRDIRRDLSLQRPRTLISAFFKGRSAGSQNLALLSLLLSRDERRSDPIVVDISPRALSRLNTSFRLLLESQQSRAPALRQLSLVAELFDVLTRPSTQHTLRNRAVRQAVWLLLKHIEDSWTIDALAARQEALDLESPATSATTATRDAFAR